MPEIDNIYSSKVKHTGFFVYPDFYRFCYDWLSDEMDLDVVESAYVEKINGDSKNVEFEWKGKLNVTDYFQFKVKVKCRIIGMTKVELEREGKKLKGNSGVVEVKMSANLVHDHKGRFEQSWWGKFFRSIYEKWIIPGRVAQYEQKLAGDADEFLGQVKAYLGLEGSR